MAWEPASEDASSCRVVGMYATVLHTQNAGKTRGGTMVFLAMMAVALLLIIYAGSAVYLYYGYKNNMTL
jgi:hypothetical protein